MLFEDAWRAGYVGTKRGNPFLVTSNLPFGIEWTEVFGFRVAFRDWGVAMDRLTHHDSYLLEMNWRQLPSQPLSQKRRKLAKT